MQISQNKNVIIGLLLFYKRFISPILERVFGHACRFTPTCSEYMVYSIQKFGTLRGVFLGLVRLLKCNPFSEGGYDPVKV